MTAFSSARVSHRVEPPWHDGYADNKYMEWGPIMFGVGCGHWCYDIPINRNHQSYDYSWACCLCSGDTELCDLCSVKL